MSAQKFKYVNLNPFPIILPGMGGVGCQIAPNQSTTNEWFSRFCGKKQLTAIPIGPAVKHVAVPGKKGQPAVTSKRKRPPISLKGVLEQETKDYKKINGLYICKRCETFRTGSKKFLEEHIKDYHQSMVDLAAEDPKVHVVAEVVVDKSNVVLAEPVIEPVVEKIPEPVKEPIMASTQPLRVEVESIVEPETEELPVEEPDTFACTICGKEFRTGRGLKMHCTKMHLNKED